MTRTHLAQFIAQVGIIDASIKLGRHPIALERWRDGQEAIPQAVSDRLAWRQSEWRAGFFPDQQVRIQAMANSKGVELDKQTAAELWEIAPRGER